MSEIDELFWGLFMKWGKDPNKRTKFGLWLDENEIFQREVADASGLSNSIISALCNDHEYKPSYLVYRKLKSGLKKLGYDIEGRDFW
jgi:predicted XRE-type DNA-binding protein